VRYQQFIRRLYGEVTEGFTLSEYPVPLNLISMIPLLIRIAENCDTDIGGILCFELTAVFKTISALWLLKYLLKNKQR
jgi:hypothetical protein